MQNPLEFFSTECWFSRCVCVLVCARGADAMSDVSAAIPARNCGAACGGRCYRHVDALASTSACGPILGTLYGLQLAAETGQEEGLENKPLQRFFSSRPR